MDFKLYESTLWGIFHHNRLFIFQIFLTSGLHYGDKVILYYTFKFLAEEERLSTCQLKKGFRRLASSLDLPKPLVLWTPI